MARIYDPDSLVLSEDGMTVEDSGKLHKYDGAFYSKMSMNVDGGEAGTGVLNITADNEGLDTELHLTINGGTINITSGNDGINTNEDNVSVTTVNGGSVNIQVAGETGEGDGIDSNGWAGNQRRRRHRRGLLRQRGRGYRRHHGHHHQRRHSSGLRQYV